MNIKKDEATGFVANHWQSIVLYFFMAVASFLSLQFIGGGLREDVKTQKQILEIHTSQIAESAKDIAVTKIEISGIYKGLEKVELALKELTAEVRRK